LYNNIVIEYSPITFYLNYLYVSMK